jgi:RND family efflux transporter MFP subunit
MKKLFLIIGLAVSVIACNKPADKSAELAKLIKEHDQLAIQIAKLQAEIAAADTTSGSGLKTMDVAVQEIKTAPFNHYIEIQGYVDGDENVAVSPQMAGIVTKIFVKEGSKVSKGQLLAELDAGMTKKTIDGLKQQLEFATTLYKKQKNLWDQKIGSEVQYLSAKNQMESLESNLQTLEEQLALSKITSPINGTVESIPIKVGAMASPGFPAFRVINFSQTKVVAELAEAYAPKVKAGDKVNIFFPDHNTEIASSLNFSSRYISPVNRTFQVESKISNPGFELRANMVAVMKINDYTAANAVTIPVNAVQKDQNGQFVFVVVKENNVDVAQKVNIQMGMIYNGLAEIVGGLKAGDKVITVGFQDINPGQPVKY